MPIERAQRWGLVLGINLLVTAGLIGGMEGCVRLLRSDIGPAATDARLFQDSVYVGMGGVSVGLRPGAAGHSNGVRIDVGRDGMPIYSGNQGKDSSAVWLLLGDSVAMGIGVDPDSSVGGQLAASSELYLANPSVIGYDSGDYLRVGRAHLARGGVQRLSVVWCLNDAYPVEGVRAGPVRVGGGNAGAWLNTHSRLYRWAKGVALDRPSVYLAHDERYYRAEAAGLDSAVNKLVALAEAATEAGAAFEVVVVPYEPQLRSGSSEPAIPQTVISQRLRQRGVRVRDLLPDFRAAAGDAPSSLYLWSDGIHLSERGHARLASALR